MSLDTSLLFNTTRTTLVYMLLQSDEPNSDGIFSVMIVVKWGSLTTKKSNCKCRNFSGSQYRYLVVLSFSAGFEEETVDQHCHKLEVGYYMIRNFSF